MWTVPAADHAAMQARLEALSGKPPQHLELHETVLLGPGKQPEYRLQQSSSRESAGSTGAASDRHFPTWDMTAHWPAHCLLTSTGLELCELLLLGPGRPACCCLGFRDSTGTPAAWHTRPCHRPAASLHTLKRLQEPVLLGSGGHSKSLAAELQPE